jgi:dynein heavy chain
VNSALLLLSFFFFFFFSLLGALQLSLGKLRDDLVGDAFLSCAAISYYGPFTGPYRDDLVSQWLAALDGSGVPRSNAYSLVATLGDPVEVRDWQNFSLPSDNVSTNNGILVTRARRWPLMIDPQGQANRWIRKMEALKPLAITTMKDLNLLRALETCVRVGRPLLIEDVEETIEPALEPILQRAVYKQGNRLLITIGDGEVGASFPPSGVTNIQSFHTKPCVPFIPYTPFMAVSH